MDCKASFLTYAQTGYFSTTVLDYVLQSPSIKPFYNHPVSIAGMQAAIEQRKKYPTDRKLLVTILKKQYSSLEVSKLVEANIESLANENTFTITTAHQPNIFTGPLYFIYKILQVAKLAEQLKESFPENNFVPVYYMGSEDADLDELGHIFCNGEKKVWETNQTGAVGFYGSSTATYGTVRYGTKLKKLFQTQVVGSGFTVSLQFVSESTDPAFSLDAATLEYATYDRR
jgi:uncharacterized protein YllA (UPF0747 family)